MAKNLTVTVKTVKAGFEGTVCIPGLRVTKLARKDGSTSFPTTSALKSTARALGTRLGLNIEYVERKTKKTCCKPKCCAVAEKALTTPLVS